MLLSMLWTLSRSPRVVASFATSDDFPETSTHCVVVLSGFGRVRVIGVCVLVNVDGRKEVVMKMQCFCRGRFVRALKSGRWSACVCCSFWCPLKVGRHVVMLFLLIVIQVAVNARVAFWERGRRGDLEVGRHIPMTVLLIVIQVSINDLCFILFIGGTSKQVAIFPRPYC